MHRHGTRSAMALTVMAMGLMAFTSGTAQSRSLSYRWFKVKEGAVKLTRANATLTHSWTLKNGVTVKQRNRYVNGTRQSTERVFSSNKGNRTRVVDSTGGHMVDKVRRLNNGTTARWTTYRSKQGPMTFSSKEVKGSKGGGTKTMTFGDGTRLRVKQWATPTAVLGVSTTRDGQGRLTGLRHFGHALAPAR